MILVAVVLFARPSAGALAMVWVIGAFAMVAGGMLFGRNKSAMMCPRA